MTTLPVNSNQNASGLRWPHFLPDGRHFLVNDRVDGVFVAALEGKEIRKVSTIDSRVEYADGHLFFGRKGNLFAQRFEFRTDLRGVQLPVLNAPRAPSAHFHARRAVGRWFMTAVCSSRELDALVSASSAKARSLAD